MTDERDHRGTDPEPLEVLVARALNWTDVQWTTSQGAWGRHPSGKGGQDGKGYGAVPRYGFDSPDGWSATGPLATNHEMDLTRPGDKCIASSRRNRCAWEYGESYPEAIARLVVKLAEMGKLVKAEK